MRARHYRVTSGSDIPTSSWNVCAENVTGSRSTCQMQVRTPGFSMDRDPGRDRSWQNALVANPPCAGLESLLPRRTYFRREASGFALNRCSSRGHKSYSIVAQTSLNIYWYEPWSSTGPSMKEVA
jgi:hypothetical protein